MDARYINPFVASVKNVFQMMASLEIKVGKPFIVRPHGEPGADVSAVIGLSGDAVGCVVLTFGSEAASRLAGRFAGVEMTLDHPDFSDAIGELANMVVGHAKAKLDGLNVSISLPSVVIGREHVVSQSRITPRLALPCSSELGSFHVEVAMEIEKPAAAEVATAGAQV